MMKDRVWLGSLRGPVRIAMIASIAAALLIFFYFIVMQFVSGDAYGMYEMIRPRGKPVVWAMLFALTAALIFASLFLSDEIGSIESDPHGFFDVLSLVLSRLAMIGTVFIVLVMFYEVVSRYVFSRPTLWANELSLWIAAFVFLLAGQYAMQQRSHIRIYVIYDLMPRWLRKTADCLSVFLIWAFAFSLVWGGYADAKTRLLRMETFGTAWDPPIPAIIKPAILITIVLVALQALSNLIADWHKEAEHHVDEIDKEEIENIRRTLEN